MIGNLQRRVDGAAQAGGAAGDEADLLFPGRKKPEQSRIPE
ncbi:MAG: hypothetical protein AB1767_11470 [Bacillota bacterium]